jgi:aspartyl-tRNA(Asn)/glutamyl-tRNA(Gln) amidotransferase subunit A
MARRVTDLARIYTVMAGYDPFDPFSLPHATPDVISELRSGVAGVRVAVASKYFFEKIDPEIDLAVREAAAELKRLGAEVFEVEIPGAEQAQDHLLPLLYADAASFHRKRLEKEPERFGKDVRVRLEPGRTMMATDYARCLRWVERWRRDMKSFFSKRAEAVLTPTAGIPAPLADPESDVIEETARLSRFNWVWPGAGVPALSLPCGFTAEGLPIGMQLAAAHWQEPLLLRIGFAYQSATDWHLREPPIVTRGR